MVNREIFLPPDSKKSEEYRLLMGLGDTYLSHQRKPAENILNPYVNLRSAYQDAARFASETLPLFHPFPQYLKAQAEQDIELLPEYTEMTKDTLQRWPAIFRGKVTSADQSVSHCIQFKCEYDIKYLTIINTLSKLSPKKEVRMPKPLIYQDENNTTCVIPNDFDTMYLRDNMLGPNTAIPYTRYKGITPPLLVLSPDPMKYLQEVCDAGFLDMLQQYDSGKLRLSDDMYHTFRTLDFILLYPESNRMFSASALFPSREGEKRGVALGTKNRSSIVDGKKTKTALYDFLKVAHELRHDYDSRHYHSYSHQFESVLPEVRASCEQVDTAKRNGLDISSANHIHRPIQNYTSIMSGQRDPSVMLHNLIGVRDNTFHILRTFPAKELKNLIPKVRRYLMS